jgi:hypothetical protein
MGVHDWSRVDAGTFHGFHTAWVSHLSETLNDGILPPGYYALPEQHLGRSIGDVLALHTGSAPKQGSDGGLALIESPPRVSRKRTVSASPRALRRTLVIRHVSGHQIVALVEIVSPANKDRAQHVDDFATKVVAALASGIHVLMVDLISPGPHDPRGMHGAIWQMLDDEPEEYDLPTDAPLTLASYVAVPEVDAYIEHLALGAALQDMPLILNPDRYIYAPLATTYQMAFRGLPKYWRDVLEDGK